MQHAAKVRQAPAAAVPPSRAAVLPDHRPAAVAQRELIRQVQSGPRQSAQRQLAQLAAAPIQRKVGFEFETDIGTRKRRPFSNNWHMHDKGEVLSSHTGYKLTADVDVTGDSQLEVIIDPIDETAVADRNALYVTAAAIRTKLDHICAGSNVAPAVVAANTIANVNGSRFLGYSANVPNNVRGQLQMTGGIPMSKLFAHVSGAQATNYIATLPPIAMGVVTQDTNVRGVLNAYTAGPIAAQALLAVGADPVLNLLPVPDQEQVAAIVTMMATMAVNTRTAGAQPYAKAHAGPMMARTNFAAIVMALPAAPRAALTTAMMRTLLLTTINAVLPGHVAPAAIGDPVIPAGSVNNAGVAPNLTGLTIGAWADGVVPTAGFFGGLNKGRDLLTKKRFPGTQAQRDEIESMGGYGKKTDADTGVVGHPGRRPIVEFRSLQGVFLDDLPSQLRRLLRFLNT